MFLLVVYIIFKKISQYYFYNKINIVNYVFIIKIILTYFYNKINKFNYK